ncbi:MAG: hypothetical protein FH749_13225 [Firmicutes bacterium]|nr:hypothetical protein [Bacillota bacterium]
MAFNFLTTSADSSVSSGTIAITVSPETGLFDVEDMVPGDSDAADVTVTNIGDVDCLYYISADWHAGDETSARMAALLANKLEVSVEVDTESLYTGTLAGLIDQPEAGRELSLATESEDVTFTITLPADTGSLYQDINVDFDIIFVATEAEEQED